ncbi:MFS transporter [Natronococcus pandeyae]|uniref:Lysosomal dipeptide transporter MFSD1 n=1 Tax=Natronococcus pandeyae TaxID=2055836 RepID=A0A8J8PZU5_9EURY|nr:MFS transporter [Natronococcus pandeyae]TYL37871.1 MFS transporter [Natronococcus pandeyae]
MNLLTDPTKRRWLAWGALALVFLLVNVHRLSTAVLSEQLTVDFGITAAQLGTLHASFFVIYAIVQIPTGALADRYGPRYVGAAGAFTLSLGAIGFTASDGYLVAFLSRALIGLGSGVIFISILRFCANWYRIDEFATMTGLTGGIAGLGAIFATTPLAVAIDWFGWRQTVFGLALLGFVAGGAVLALTRSSPADAGLEPIENVPEQPSVTLAETIDYLRKLLGDADQWLLSIIFFSSMGTILTIIGLWGVPYLVIVYELDVTTASYYTLLGSVGMLIGAPMVGWISDRIGRRFLPMAVGLGAFVLTLATVPVFGNPPLIVIAATYFFIGFSLGFVMLSLSIVKEKYPPEASGVATATVNGAGFFGATVLPPLMGIALDRYRTGDVVAGTVVYTEFGYRVAFAITTVAVAVAFLSSLWLYVREQRRDTGISESGVTG